MKKISFTIIAALLSTALFAQKVVLSPSVISGSVYHDKSKALRDIEPIPPKDDRINWEDGIVHNNFQKRTINKDFEVFSSGKDPVRQKEMGTRQVEAAIINFEGIDKAGGGGATPPDTDGDVGPDHYFQMVNTAFKIFDKLGNSLYGPADNSTIFDGFDDGQPYDDHNDGDPIVLYDETVDRWLVTHFALLWPSGPHYMLLAVSETNDPLGAYYRYAFEFTDMPDYPKFGIWHDGYYMTLNSNTNNTVVFERDSMLVGGEARMVAFDLPDYPGSGFKSALAADCDGTPPPAGSPNYIVYYNDDAWGSYPTDHLRIWEFKTDWANTDSSTLSLASTLATSAFDSQFSGGFANISQPGTTQKIDAIMQAVMFRMHYRNFGAYQAIVLNFPVDVDGNDQAGIRWYELRDDGSGWYIFQEGTYAPDTDSRFVGSIAMDINGNIGLAYSVSSSTVFPSLRFTGHTYDAPPGVMNVMEQEIVAGAGSQTSSDRFGDYSMLSVDPDDNSTFWFTSEYINAAGDWQTRIAAFVIDPNAIAPVDAGPQAFVSPVASVDLTAAEVVTLRVANYGSDTLYDIPVAYQFEGGAIVWDTVYGPLTPAATVNHSFPGTVDMSVEQTYSFLAFTAYPGDTINDNDTVQVSMEHAAPSYCDGQGGGAWTSIDNVQLNTINNASSYTAYSDYTGIATELGLGTDNNISVTITPSGFGGDEVIVWVDWNQNLDFTDPGEKTILDGTFNGVISVPADALMGDTRMRLRLHNTFVATDTPCGSASVGEVEDYTITVVDGVRISEIYPEDLNFKILPNPTQGRFSIQMDCADVIKMVTK